MTRKASAIFGALPREKTLASRVVTQMETLIADGGLADGSRLPPERDLATQFGVSRTVIREAVAALSARGLLHVQAGSGTVVRRPSVESIARMISVSLAVSGTSDLTAQQARETARALAMDAAAAAAERRTDEDFEILSGLVREYAEPQASLVPGQSIGPRPAPGGEASFIGAVAHAARNHLAALILECLLALGGTPDPAQAARCYRAVADEIRKGDAKDARRAMRDLYDVPDLSPRPPSKKEKERKAAH